MISAIPDNTNELPTFNLDSATGLLTYNFKGETGSNFRECFGMICDGISSSSLVDPISGPCLDTGIDKMAIISCQLNSGCSRTERYEELKNYQVDVIPGRKNYWDDWEDGDTYLEDNFNYCGSYAGGAERWCPKDN